MAVALRARATPTNINNQQNIVVNKPAGLAVGDVMLVHITNVQNTTAAVITAPNTNWVRLGFLNLNMNNDGARTAWLFGKIADAADVAASTYTFTSTVAAATSIGECIAYSGAHQTDPWGFISVAKHQAANPTWFDARDYWGDSMSVLFASVDQDAGGMGALTPPSGWTERADYLYDTGALKISQYIADKVLGAAPSTTGDIATTGGSGTPMWSTFQVVLREATKAELTEPRIRGIHGHNIASSVDQRGVEQPWAIPGDLVFMVVDANSTNATQTTPSGFTVLQDWIDWGPTNRSRKVLWRAVAQADSAMRQISGHGTAAINYVYNLIAVANCDTTPSVHTHESAQSQFPATESVTTDKTYALLLRPTVTFTAGFTETPPTGFTEQVDRGRLYVGTNTTLALSYKVQPVAGATGTTQSTLSSSAQWTTSLIVVNSGNYPPNAPNLIDPADGAVLDRSLGQRFDWDFSDPNSGDSQSKFDLDYRLVGAGSWTTVTTITPTTHHDFAGNHFAVGNYEWRVRTYDAIGVVGPYSSIRFFSAANVPTPPTITDPVNNSTISTSDYTLLWSVADQDEFQVRKVADLAGAPDTGTVYYDSGVIVSTSTRSHVLTFPTNGRVEHLQVRIKENGLWSNWASVKITVNYTPPNVPTLSFTAQPTLGRMRVTVANSGGGITVSENHLYRSDDGFIFERIAILAPNVTYDDYTCRGKIQHTYYVVAVGTNGANNSSIIYTAPVLALKGTWMHYPDEVPVFEIHQFLYNDNGGDDLWEAQYGLLQFAGRVDPVMEYGDAEDYTLYINLALEDDRGDREALATFRRAKRVICVRDFRGRKIFTSIPTYSQALTNWGSRTQLTLRRLDWSEAI